MYRLALLLACLVLGAPVASGTGPRLALIVGNGAYEHFSRLANPARDAADVAAALQRLSFRTTLLVDTDLARFEDAVRAFGAELARDPATAAVFFFAGHGVQSGGVNYLIPVEADVRAEAELRRKALSAQEILDHIGAARTSFTMVILDACRDNPFAGAFRTSTRGLAMVAAAPPETIVVYATAAGAVAEDGAAANSPFSAALLRHLATPGIDAEAMLRRVTSDVQAATANRQTPYRYSSLTTDFQFAPAGRPSVQARQPPPPAAPPAVEDTGDGLISVRGGTYRMGDSTGAGTPDARPAHEVSVSSFCIGTNEVTWEEYDAYCEDVGQNKASDHGWGRGTRPAVSIGIVDIAKYCNWRSQREGRTPCYEVGSSFFGPPVTWKNRSANGYRLPTEAEWEYAARGGAYSRGRRFSGSDNADKVAWHSGNAGGMTHEVGTKAPNELGLHDMSGNVWEWCWDLYEAGYYRSSPAVDPAGPDRGDRHTIRGGGWNSGTGEVQVSHRSSNGPLWFNNYGFRIVRGGR